jgi:hypothetical protein
LTNISSPQQLNISKKSGFLGTETAFLHYIGVKTVTLVYFAPKNTDISVKHNIGGICICPCPGGPRKRRRRPRPRRRNLVLIFGENVVHI